MPPRSERTLGTDRQIAGASSPPDGRDRAEYRITGTPGLVLRVTPANVKSWGYWLKDPATGRWRLKTLGRYPALSLASARDLARRHSGGLAEGRNPFDRTKTTLTFEELGDIYVERYARPKKRSWQQDARSLRHDVCPTLGRVFIEKIERQDLVRL